MFNVMLIDDELDVRERVISMIEWDTLGLHLAAEAADGETAKELYTLYRPEILITDINIPITNGLELIGEFKKLDPDLQIIVITGYDDFSYAQTALRLGVSDLLLKPIFPDRINDALRKIVDSFHETQREKASADAMRKLIADNLEMIRKTYLTDLLHTKPTPEPNALAKLEQLGITGLGPYYTVAIAAIMRDVEQYEAVTLLMEKTAQTIFEQTGLRFFLLFDSHFRLNLLFSHSEPDISDLIEDSLNKLKSQLAFMTDASLFAGIGSTVDRLEDLNLSFEQALSAYRYQNILNEDTVIHYKNVLSFEDPISCQQFITKNLLEPLRQGELTLLRSEITDYFTVLVSRPNPIGKMLDFAYSYVATIGSECSRQNINTEKLPGFSTLLRDLGNSSEPGEILRSILALTEEFVDIMNAQRADSRNILIEKARMFMKENLSNSLLSMEDVSSHIGLSRAYFCALFHKEMGVSFTNYLKYLRIEEAKRLLVETGEKVLDIASKTGFASPKYFSYVFKQTTGKTPLEFQRMTRITGKGDPL